MFPALGNVAAIYNIVRMRLSDCPNLRGRFRRDIHCVVNARAVHTDDATNAEFVPYVVD